MGGEWRIQSECSRLAVGRAAVASQGRRLPDYRSAQLNTILLQFSHISLHLRQTSVELPQ